jgi:hypothetical protein
MKLGLTPQILRPTGRPQDIFTRTDGGAQLGQLAQGLSQFTPSLQRFGLAMQEGEDQDAKTAGENAARDFVEKHKTYKDAIDAGLIDRHQSPFFRLGAYETFGRASSYSYLEDFQQELGKSDVATSTTPGDFDEFEGKFREKWSKEHLGEKIDPFFANSFGKQADTLIEGERNQFSEGAVRRLTQQTSDSYLATVHSLVKQGTEQQQKPEDILAQINTEMARQIAGHMDKGLVNQLTAQAITSAAKRLDNASVLELMDKLKVGGGYMSGTSYGSKLYEDATNEIAATNQSKHIAFEQAQKEAKEKATDDIVTEAVTRFDAQPDARTANIHDLVARMAVVNPEKAEQLVKMRDAWADSSYKGDPQVTSGLFMGVFNGTTGLSTLNNALSARLIDKNDYAQLADLLHRRAKEDNKVTKLFNDDGYKEGKSRLEKLFVVQFGAIEKPGNSQRYENAIAEFTAQYFRWKEGAGANADPMKVNDFLTNTISSKVLKFGDGTQNSDRDRIPAPTLGPTVPDWKKQPIADQSTILQAEKEVAEFAAQKRARVSNSTIELLKAAHIDLSNKNEVRQFFIKQKLLGPPVVAPEPGNGD